jgi:hypothetical protein
MTTQTTTPPTASPVFYVLGVYGCNEGSPWVMTDSEGQSWALCERAINWQAKGQGDAREWAICTYDAATQTFTALTRGLHKCEPIHGIKPGKGPFTTEAWARKQAEFR